MPLLDAVRDMQNETTFNALQESRSSDRKVGGEMGKYDFLMLLSAQLRYQNPLEPQNDTDFASQLAQFSSLEQMQNMNSSLTAMSNYQSYGLIGKFVLAEAVIDGKYGEVAGVVESIFTREGVTYAQIGEYVVPVASITEVFDTGNILTPEMFMQTANMLIGKTIIAEVDGKDIEGLVTRILVDQGSLFAQIVDEDGEPHFIPVNTIVDIREVGSKVYTPKPETPPDAMYFQADPDSDGFLEFDETFAIQVGRWDWSVSLWEWVFTSFSGNDDN